MYKFITTLAFLFLICAVAYADKPGRPQAQTKSIQTKGEMVIGGVKFPEGSRVTVTQGDVIYYAWPGQDFLISGVTVLKGTQIMLWPNGQLQQLWALEGQKVLDLVLKPGTWTGFKENGKLDYIFFANPETVRGLTIVQHALFYDNGKFKQVVLNSDQKVGPCLFKSGEIRFHPNGNVMAGILAEACSVQARDNKNNVKDENFTAGTRIYFDADEIAVGAFGPKAGPTVYSQEVSPLEN